MNICNKQDRSVGMLNVISIIAKTTTSLLNTCHIHAKIASIKMEAGSLETNI